VETSLTPELDKAKAQLHSAARLESEELSSAAVQLRDHRTLFANFSGVTWIVN